MCRGNTGEVYPNVVSPLTGSIVGVPFALGQRRCAIETGLATHRQMADFDGLTTAMAANIAGYLFVNVSLARSATARTPGLTVDMVDRILRDEVSNVGFWKSATRQEDLRGQLFMFLDEHTIVDFDRADATADRLMDLAKANHGKLTRQGEGG